MEAHRLARQNGGGNLLGPSHRGDGQSIFSRRTRPRQIFHSHPWPWSPPGGPQAGRHLAGQLVGSAHVARGQRNGKLPPPRPPPPPPDPWSYFAAVAQWSARQSPPPPQNTRPSASSHALRHQSAKRSTGSVPAWAAYFCHTKRPGPRQSPPQIGREVCPPEGKGHNPNAHCFASRKPVVKAGWYSSDRL